MGLQFHIRTFLYKAVDKDGRVLYTGISSQPLCRIKDHKKKEWYKDVVRFEIAKFADRFEAMRAERDFIEGHFPPNNIIHNAQFTRIGRGKYERAA